MDINDGWNLIRNKVTFDDLLLKILEIIETVEIIGKYFIRIFNFVSAQLFAMLDQSGRIW